jgi:hypothetical protein
MDMRAIGEVRLDGVENSNQHWQRVLGAGVGGKRSALPTCIEIRIAVEDPDGYADRWNRRSSGECWFKAAALSRVTILAARTR